MTVLLHTILYTHVSSTSIANQVSI